MQYSEIPWNRYALIADLIRRFDQQRNALGKTALQKMVFLLQRVFGLDFDYAYTLYTFGPFCADLARDLDIVAGLGGPISLMMHLSGGTSFDLVRRPMNFGTAGGNSLIPPKMLSTR